MDLRTTKFKPGILGLLLLVLTLALYWPVQEFGFINYDDPVYVTENPVVEKGLTWEGLGWAFAALRGSNWHPLTWISHMTDAQAFGNGAAGPHWVNVSLHAANTLLLFLVLFRMTGAPWRSALVAALFGWHPLHVESVAWISERKDVLSTFFFLLTLWFYAGYVRRRQPEPVPRRAAFAYGAALVCFLLGLLSKPMLVTAPFVLLLLDVWPLQRVTLQRADRGRWGELLREKIPFFALSIASCLVTFWAQKRGGAMATLDSISIGGRVGNALVAYATYLRKMVWPTDLAVFYPHPGSLPWATILLSGALVAGVTAVVIGQAQRRSWLPWGWFWYLGTLVPVIGLVQVGDQAYADRYTYVPLIGIFVAAAWELNTWCSSHPRAVHWAKLSVGLVLVACGALTHWQLQHWRSGETLFRRALAVTKNNYVAHNNLGIALVNAGAKDEARFHFEKALTILPSYEAAHLNLGNLLLDQGFVDQAVGHLWLAVKFKPDSAEGHYNLATALIRQEKYEPALAEFKQALSMQPNHTNAYYNLGIALTKLGRLQEAESRFRRALELDPRFGFAHYNLGLVLSGLGRTDEACEHFRQAARFSPDYLPARNELGAVLLASGRFEEAAAVYRDVLQTASNSAPAHNNLGLALARLGQPEAACAHFAEVVRLEPRNADAHYNLGNGLFEQGRYADAERHYLQVICLKPEDTAARRKLALCRARQGKAVPTGRAP